MALARSVALALLLPVVAAAELPIPPLTGPVVDTARLLDAGARSRLEDLARSARARENGQGVQLQYLIVPTLGGEAIEDFSIRAAEAWKIGTKGRDNGLLVTVAVQEHRFRIEVGGGLEGEIPDVLARRVGEQILRPAFKAGRFGDGLFDAGAQLLTLAGVATEDVARHARGAPPRGVTGIPIGGGVLVGIFVVLWILGLVLRGFGPRRRSHLWWGGGPWGGGGFGGGGGWGGGGGGGGGGGWSGGGGGFSGGGSSGSW